MHTGIKVPEKCSGNSSTNLPKITILYWTAVSTSRSSLGTAEHAYIILSITKIYAELCFFPPQTCPTWKKTTSTATELSGSQVTWISA